MATTAAVKSAQKSTIVRANFETKASVVTLTLCNRFAPGLGARLAVRMWMTVQPNPAAGTRPPLTEPGERTVLTAGNAVARPPRGLVGRRRAGGIVTESWGTGPVVYLVHGWGGYRGQLGAFVRPLTEAGFRVVAMDMPVHGESGPGQFGRKRTLMTDFLAGLSTAVAHYGRPHAFIAHSAGAGAAAIATLNGLPAGRLVLIAPMPSPMVALDPFVRVLRIGPRVRERMQRRVERIGGRPTRQFDVVARAAECEELPPILVIHDTGDRVLPFSLGAQVAGAWPGARLIATTDLGHQRILRDPGVIQAAVEFVAGSEVPARG